MTRPTTAYESVYDLPSELFEDPEELAAFINDAWPDADADEKCTLFDLAAGLYWYCNDWHGGQWSTLYRVQCGLDYHPGCGECSAEDAGEQAAYVYHMLSAAYEQSNQD